jgi:integrase
MLQIPAESDKSGQDRVLPIAPEFADFLQATPAQERHGRVFKLVGKRRDRARMHSDWVSRVVCQIGREARILVDERERRLVRDARSGKARSQSKKGKKELEETGSKRKYASTHDLRRAFGLRWSTRVMPIVLQQLMRHESIETTLRYYVGRDADAVADTLWEAVESANSGAVGNKNGNIASALHQAIKEEKSQPAAE